MATDTSLLMGEVIEDPENQSRNIEHLLVGFLSSLVNEQLALTSTSGPLTPSTSQSKAQEET